MLLAILILFFVSLSGLILRAIPASRHLSGDLVALGAGAMISVALVHIFPEAIGKSEFAVFAFIGGFLLIYLIENFLIIHSCVEDHCHYHHVSIISWIAIFIHTIFDGIGIGAGFTASEKLGYIILAGVVIHQIPVSFSLSLLLRESHFKKSTQTILLFVFALAAPLGFFASRSFFEYTGNEALVAICMALAGGSLLYIGASDLLPVVHKKTKNRFLVMTLFFAGAIIVSLAKFLE